MWDVRRIEHGEQRFGTYCSPAAGSQTFKANIRPRQPEMTRTSKPITAITDACPEFPDWPRRWMGVDEDVPYGLGILEVFAPFIQKMIDDGRARKTIVTHCTNLWLLGGEIIRRVALYNEYHIEPHRMVMNSVGPDGGISCRHLDCEAHVSSYDGTCRRLYRFLQEQGRAGQSRGRPNAG